MRAPQAEVGVLGGVPVLAEVLRLVWSSHLGAATAFGAQVLFASSIGSASVGYRHRLLVTQELLGNAPWPYPTAMEVAMVPGMAL